MSFTLPELPYAYDALQLAIDAKTMEIHHGKHHQAYVTNLNAAVEKHASLAGKSLEDLVKAISSLPEDVRTPIRNNGGGHWNHDFFWKGLASANHGPVGTLKDALEKTFGAVESFKDKFKAAAVGRFGSGWAWLIVKEGDLHVTSTPNQDNPLMDVADVKGTPILGLDVWEHAYYLRYQNRRPDYIDAFWSVVNWEQAEALYEGAMR